MEENTEESQEKFVKLFLNNELPITLQYEREIWQLVLSGKVTLHELKTSWTIDDVQAALSFMNLQSAIEKVLMKPTA